MIRAPLGCPAHFFNFLVDAGSHGAVADVGVDLNQEIPADDHRLAFRMIDIGGDYGAPTGNFVADKLRGGPPRNTGAETLTAEVPNTWVWRLANGLFTAQVFSDGNKFHFRGDNSLARVLQLRHDLAGFGAKRLAARGQCHHLAGRIVGALIGCLDFLNIATLHDP